MLKLYFLPLLYYNSDIFRPVLIIREELLNIIKAHTEYHRRNGPNFGRVFVMLNYTDITQNAYIQS